MDDDGNRTNELTGDKYGKFWNHMTRNKWGKKETHDARQKQEKPTNPNADHVEETRAKATRIDCRRLSAISAFNTYFFSDLAATAAARGCICGHAAAEVAATLEYLRRAQENTIACSDAQHIWPLKRRCELIVNMKPSHLSSVFLHDGNRLQDRCDHNSKTGRSFPSIASHTETSRTPQRSRYALVGTIIEFHSEKSAETKTPHSTDRKDESNVPDCSS